MRLPVSGPFEPSALWSVPTFGRSVTPAGRTYWHENRGRAPASWLVVQASLAGCIVLRDTGGENRVEAGQIVIFGFGDDSAYGWPGPLPEPYACKWVNLQGAGLREHLEVFRQRFGAVISPGLDHPLLEQMDELSGLASPPNPASPTDLAHAVHLFIMRLFEFAQHRQQQRQTPVQRAIDAILARPAQPWSLQEIAHRFGCTREHLSRCFYEQRGQWPASYIAEARLHRAMQLLRDTTLPVSDIAKQAGFGTTHSLARCVRDAAGCSPTAYRER